MAWRDYSDFKTWKHNLDKTEQRREKLRKLMRKEGVPALLVTNEPNVTYLTGFTGDSSFLLLTESKEVLLTDGRYTTQLAEECPGLDLRVRTPSSRIDELLEQVVKQSKLGRLAIEASSMSVVLYDTIRGRIPKVELVSTHGLVEQLREIKDKGEIAEIREAVRMAERAFAVVKASLRPTQTEREVAHELERQIRLFGGEGCSFKPIVAVGDRAALPHYQPGERKISESELLLIDWGARGRLYVSDLTRILVTGRISPKLRRIYGLVLNAQQAAIDAIRPGVAMKEIDKAARSTIAKGGHGKHFNHGLGHGIGLEIHEAPRLAANENRQLQAGMVITVEPGIYLPKWGGVRIEDDVLVTRDGHEVLSSVSKDLTDCVVG